MAKVAAEVGSTANKYEVLAKLATGGMADIFLARSEGVAEVERYCVLKRILRERAGDAQLVQMFLDEARLAAQLQHPNIASVYDVGKLGESYFFTMEYVHGETVRSLLHRATGLRRRLPLACALTIVAGAAAGLHHAHERNGNDGRPLGIVHRDVSPSNVMVSYEGHTKVVDFGVAKAAHRAVETKSGTVKGKISYLSPEQCRGERVDRRSDLFSLGIVMWEMLTGKRLYRHDSDFGNMSAIVYDAPVPPSHVRPDLPRDVDAIVLRLLAKSAAERFQSADEVVDEIEAAAVRAGLMLSVAAVGRFVRELCGRRLEPWLELAPKPATNEPVTLTNASVPTGLELEAANRIEVQLANLAELSLDSVLPAPPAVLALDLALSTTARAPRGPAAIAAAPSEAAAVAIAAAPVDAARVEAVPVDAARVEAVPVEAAPLPSISGPHGAPSGPHATARPRAPTNAPPVMGTGPHPSPAQHGSKRGSAAPYTPGAPRAIAKLDRDASGAIAVPPAVAPLGISIASATAPTLIDHAARRVPPPRRPGRLAAWIGGALLVGAAAAWWTARSGGSSAGVSGSASGGNAGVALPVEPRRDAPPEDAAPQVPAEPAPPAPLEPARQAQPHVSDAPPPDAAEPSAPPPDAASAHAPPPRAPADSPPRAPADAPSRAPADAPPRAPADAPPRAPADAPPRAPADAPPRTPAASTSRGSSRAHATASAAAPPDAPVPEAPSSDAPASPRSTTTRLDVLKVLYRDGKYADIVAACTSEITSDIAELCARAACKEGRPDRADSWIRTLQPNVRLKISAACQQDMQNRAADAAAAPASRASEPPRR